jgi:hypothetical protein
LFVKLFRIQKMKFKIVFSLVVFFNLTFLSAVASKNPVERTIILSGKIIDTNNNEFLSGVSINVTDCEKTIYSDLNGNFFIYIKVKSAENFKLEFSQVGYQSKTLNMSDITGQTNNLEILLTEDKQSSM